MHKTLGAAVLLLSMFSLAQSSKPTAPASTFTSPVIVAKGKLRNQMTTIPTTTILTPSQDGLYRLSVYATITNVDPASASGWGVTVGWTDDAGVQAANFLMSGNGSQSGQFFIVSGISRWRSDDDI